MSLKTEEMYEKALVLSADVEDNFLELGRALRRLLDRDPALFQQIVKKGKLGRRKAYYLVEVSRIYDPLPVPRARLRKIGWTKLQLMGKHVSLDNVEELLELAEQTNAKELERQLHGEKPMVNARYVLMYFSPKQYAEFEYALLKNGATKSGRGMFDKEIAIINALRKAEPGLENVLPAKPKPAFQTSSANA
jgi:hypothetical protein